jgi:hypothetical protein
MKILSFLLSSALLTSTAAVAVASPNHDDQADKSDQGDTFWRGPSQKPERERGHGQPDRTMRHRWTELGTVRASGRSAQLDVDGNAPVAQIKLEADRGTASVKKVIVTFENGTSFVAKLDAQLRAGSAQTIDLPGNGRRIASIQLELRRGSRAQLTLSAR